MYIYTYIHTYTYIHICVYIYTSRSCFFFTLETGSFYKSLCPEWRPLYWLVHLVFSLTGTFVLLETLTISRTTSDCHRYKIPMEVIDVATHFTTHSTVQPPLQRMEQPQTSTETRACSSIMSTAPPPFPDYFPVSWAECYTARSKHMWPMTS